MTTRELILSCWRFDPLALVVCGAAIVAFVMSERSRHSRTHAPAFGGSRDTPARALAFGSALVLFALALVSPIGVLSDGYLFSAHMLQHLLLVLVVPPLVLLGLAPKHARVLIRPVVAWGLGVGAMWLWHAPTLCNAAANSAAMHRIQEVSLLAMGTAFWWPIVGPNAEARLRPLAGVVYLFTACTACTLLGIMVTFSPVAVCSVFRHPIDHLGVMPLIRNGWGLSPEKDQQVGGLFMWVPTCLVYGAGILGLLARWYRADAEAAGVTRLATEQTS
jgi:putative membrane protein